MARSVVLALLAAAAAAGALQACVGGIPREDVAIQRYRTILCEKAVECGCLPDEAATACGEWPPPYYEYEYGGGPGAGLAFDPDCVEPWVRWADALSCEEPVLPRLAELCPLYHGTLRAGEPCYAEREVIATDCGPGLFCLDQICRDPSRTELGAAGQPCEIGYRCDPGLTCVDPGVCMRLPGPDEPCIDGYLCNGDARCRDGLCIALPGPGESCRDTGQCRADAFCTFDFVTGDAECQRRGEVGEPCRGHSQCISGNCPAGACEEPAGVGDPCGSQLPCGPGLSCNGSQCQPDGGGATSTCDLLIAP